MRQLPHIAKAYDRFHSQGFEVLNYSMDENRQAVEAVRKKNRLAGLLGIDPKLKSFEDPVAKRMFVVILPTAFLVSADGTIISREWLLQGEKLEKVLEDYFARK